MAEEFPDPVTLTTAQMLEVTGAKSVESMLALLMRLKAEGKIWRWARWEKDKWLLQMEPHSEKDYEQDYEEWERSRK